MRTNAGLTLYSKEIVSGDEVWTRSTVEAVQWENADIANNSSRVGSAGVLEADQIVVYITFKVAPTLAIKPGDYIVRGIVDDDIEDGFTITDLRRSYPDVAVVRRVNRLDFGSYEMQHWEIGAN
jgi:hypothetical protein